MGRLLGSMRRHWLGLLSRIKLGVLDCLTRGDYNGGRKKLGKILIRCLGLESMLSLSRRNKYSIVNTLRILIVVII